MTCARLLPAFLSLLIGALALAPPARADDPDDAPPAIFKSQTLADAIAQSKASGTIVFVDFTAEWCAPCKMMERTVLRDPKVVKWITDRKAIAIRVDTDKEAALRTEYGISAWPTYIGFKNGQMIDRRLGSMNSDQFLTWLEKVDRGNQPAPGSETIVLPAPTAATEPQDLSMLSIKDRWAAACALVAAGKYEKATPEYLWLWQNMATKDPRAKTVRRTLFRDELTSLVERFPAARDPFINERDTLESRLKTEARTFEDLLDWITLNTVLAQEDRTLAWLDRVKSQSDSETTLRQTGPLLSDLLQRRKRWADIAVFLPDPVAAVRAAHEQFVSARASTAGDDAFRAKVRESFRDLFRTEAAAIYLSQLATSKDDVAARVAAAAIALDDTPATRLKLVSTAAAEGFARRSQALWLDQAEKAGSDVADLRKKVLAAPK